MKAQQGRLTTDSLLIWSRGHSIGYARDQIQSLERYKGKDTFNGIVAGSLIGAGIAVTVNSLFDTSSSLGEGESRDLVTAILAGVCGGMVGAVVGANSERWERVPLEPGLAVSRDDYTGLDLTFCF
jgi:hypothetical protein